MADARVIGDVEVVSNAGVVGDVKVVADAGVVGDVEVVADAGVVGDVEVVADAGVVGDVEVVADAGVVSHIEVVADRQIRINGDFTGCEDAESFLRVCDDGQVCSVRCAQEIFAGVGVGVAEGVPVVGVGSTGSSVFLTCNAGSRK